jgi:hypothetical protein
MDPIARHALVMVAALALATAADGRSTCTDIDAVATARTEIEAQCACERAANHHLYVRCAAGVVRKRVAGKLLLRACAPSVQRCAARSTCGRPGAVVCCLGTRCKPMKSAARCSARGGHAGTTASCCDACATTATVPTTSSSTLPGATTTLATTTTTTSTTTLPEGYACAQDASGGGAEPIMCGASVSCSLSPAGDTDAFSITVPAAAALAIEISGTNIPCWDLHDGNGTSVASACKNDNPQKKLTGPLTAGTYSIIITETVGHTSDYVLSVQGTSTSFHCGAPLALPTSSLSGVPLQPAGDTDSYEITATAGERVHIVASGPLIPCWLLFTPGGALEQNTCNANSGDGTTGPLMAGIHTLVVRESLDRATTYSLSVQQVAP